MPDLEAMYRDAHEQLNSAYVVYMKSKETSLAHEFDSIKLQACLFQYEMCVELVAFVSNNPSDFARKVSLKGVIQKLFDVQQSK